MILEKNLEKWRENHKFNEQNDHTPNISTKMATKTQIEQTSTDIDPQGCQIARRLPRFLLVDTLKHHYTDAKLLIPDNKFVLD